MKLKNLFVVTMILTGVFILSGCSSYHEIPTGHVGKILTPTGFQAKIWEAGMADLGEAGMGGAQNILVLLEANSTTVKEQFLSADASPDKQDHRILTKNGTPLAVDVYVRAMVPEDQKSRDAIFAQVTPSADKKDPRTRWITLKDVYARFAAMDVRNRIRETFSKYDGHKDVMANYTAVNKEIAEAVVDVFKLNKVPILLQNVELSNVKPDEAVWEADNEKAAADTKVYSINKIGQALRDNPQYVGFMQWEAAQKIAEIGSKNGTNTVVIVGSSGNISPETAAVASQIRNKETSK